MPDEKEERSLCADDFPEIGEEFLNYFKGGLHWGADQPQVGINVVHFGYLMESKDWKDAETLIQSRARREEVYLNKDYMFWADPYLAMSLRDRYAVMILKLTEAEFDSLRKSDSFLKAFRDCKKEALCASQKRSSHASFS